MDVTKVTWDIWNEPDIAPYFWIRSTQQWGKSLLFLVSTTFERLA